jgi:protein-S-isoprenylcysteine O-methyltransferase Ste14
VWSFYSEGRGTLAPWSPPRHLVVGGLYHYSRNPMYVSVVLILWGWALGFRSRGLAVYALAVMAAFHLRVVLGEEPWLERTHGDAWARYSPAGWECGGADAAPNLPTCLQVLKAAR